MAGGTLLLLCADDDEIDIARWLLERGADANAPAAIDSEGFGGHTALYGCLVSQPYRNGRTDLGMARLLLDHGARVDVRANLRKRLRFVDGETMHVYRGVTPEAWGRAFHDQDWVNPAVMQLLAERRSWRRASVAWSAHRGRSRC